MFITTAKIAKTTKPYPTKYILIFIFKINLLFKDMPNFQRSARFEKNETKTLQIKSIYKDGRREAVWRRWDLNRKASPEAI